MHPNGYETSYKCSESEYEGTRGFRRPITLCRHETRYHQRASREDIHQNRKRPGLTQREHSDGKNASIDECIEPAKVFPTEHGAQQAQSKELPCSVNPYAEYFSSVYTFQRPELGRYPPISRFEFGHPLGDDRIVPQVQSYDDDPIWPVPSGAFFIAPYSNLPMGYVPPHPHTDHDNSQFQS